MELKGYQCLPWFYFIVISACNALIWLLWELTLASFFIPVQIFVLSADCCPVFTQIKSNVLLLALIKSDNC